MGCWILGAVASQLDDDEEGAARRQTRGLALAGELGNPHSEVFAEQTGVWIAQLRGDVATCSRLAAAVAARAAAEGLPHWQALSETYVAWAEVMLGEAGSADALSACVRRVEAIGDGATLPYLWWLEVDALRHLGRAKEGREVARRALATLQGARRWFVDRLEAAAR